MQTNWLFQIPDGDVDEVQTIIRARLDADPAARAISDEEAETYMASAYMLTCAAPETFTMISRAFLGKDGSARNKQWRRQVTLLILKSWREPRIQELFAMARRGMIVGRLPSADVGPDHLPIATLVEGYHDGHPVIWLCYLLRETGRADQIPSFLEQLRESARRIYPLHLDVGRLLIRRLVDGVAQPTANQEPVAPQLKAQLRQKSKGAAQAKRAIQQNQANLSRQERRRKAKEASIQAYLERVHQEITAAEADLAELGARQQAEVASLLAEHAAQLATIVAESAAIQAAFTETIQTQTTAWPLSGLRVALLGEWGETEQLLIESAGGHLVSGSANPNLVLHLGSTRNDQPTTGLFCTAETGPAALERLLHRRILPQITRFRST